LYQSAGFRRGDARIHIQWSRQLTSSAGNCKRISNRGQLTYLIKLSSPIMAGVAEAERDRAIEETLIHEFAHAFAYQRYGESSHGSRAFAMVLRAVGRSDLAGPHQYDSLKAQQGGRKFHKGMLVEYELRGDTVVARILHASSRRANVFRPGLSMLVPYAHLRWPEGHVEHVPWPWQVLDIGERVGYGKQGQWHSGVIESFGPTRARVRLDNGDARLVPYGWIT
jgi:predicted SprT family Zn-dependent metalloprotease